MTTSPWRFIRLLQKGNNLFSAEAVCSPMALDTWRTPFFTSPFPKLTLLPVADNPIALTVRAVARAGTYELRFQDVVGYRAERVGVAPVKRWEAVGLREAGASTVRWTDSPWLKTFEKNDRGPRRYRGKDALRHFVIFGDEYIVEILSAADPEICQITAAL